MLIKDKDILVEEDKTVSQEEKVDKKQQRQLLKKQLRQAWGDAIDYYLRGITERYLFFSGRASRLEFWGFFVVSAFVYIPLYFLGDYIEMAMLPYYYAMATFLPSLAVVVRRLHDVNKKAILYLGSVIVPIISIFFLKELSLIVFLLWGCFLLYFFNQPSITEDGLYGKASDDDFDYGANQIIIIRKFRLLAFVLWSGLAFGAYMQFALWSSKARIEGNNEFMIEQVQELARQQGFSDSDIEKAKKQATILLKHFKAKEVSEDDLNKQIQSIVDNISAMNVSHQ